VLKNKYIIGSVIGEGGFGITYAGWDTALGQKIAVKEYYPSVCANRSHTGDNHVIPGQASKGQYFRMGKERFTQEAQSAAQFSGEAGIVEIRDYFEENDTAYIVMNYLEGGNLGEIVRSRGKLEPKTFFAVMLPLMRTLEHVHQQGMIHRDIAPDNIIMSEDGSLTLLDFGSARYYFGEETKSLSVVLKPGYAPYEQYSCKGKQGAWTDVYALCATIYKCITGVTPPDALDRISNDELKKPSELGVRLPAAVENALMKGLAIFPKDRLQTVGELRKAVERGYSKTTSQPVPSRRIKFIAVTTISLTIILLGIVLVVATPHFAENNQENLKKPTGQSHSSENSSSFSTSESSEIQKTSNDDSIARALFDGLTGEKLGYDFEKGSETITINADQSFSILYQEYVYKNGQRVIQYYSKSGTFRGIKKLTDNTYSLRTEDVVTTSSDEDMNQNGTGFPTVIIEEKNPKIYNNSEVILYDPAALVSQIPENVSMGYEKTRITPNGDYLGYYCLVDSAGTRYYSQKFYFDRWYLS
jgi:serine/threonine protein kinase